MLHGVELFDADHRFVRFTWGGLLDLDELTSRMCAAIFTRIFLREAPPFSTGLNMADATTNETLIACNRRNEGQAIKLPRRFRPDSELLTNHMASVFRA